MAVGDNKIVEFFSDFSTFQLASLLLIIVCLTIGSAATSGYADPNNTTATNGATLVIIISAAIGGIALLCTIFPYFLRRRK